MITKTDRCPLCGREAEVTYTPTHEVVQALYELRRRVRVRLPKPGSSKEEAERFRTALEQIVSCESHCEGDVVDIARKALFPEKPKGN